MTAEQTLVDLYETDHRIADQIEDVLDALETDPRTCEHEAWPHERGAAFLTHVIGTPWFVAWTYPENERSVVLVGKIFRFGDDRRRPVAISLSRSVHETLETLHATDSAASSVIERVLDRLELDPASLEETVSQAGAFVTRVPGTSIRITWSYSNTGDVNVTAIAT